MDLQEYYLWLLKIHLSNLQVSEEQLTQEPNDGFPFDNPIGNKEPLNQSSIVNDIAVQNTSHMLIPRMIKNLQICLQMLTLLLKTHLHMLIPGMTRNIQMYPQVLTLLLIPHFHMLILGMTRNLQMCLQVLTLLLKTDLHMLVPWMTRNCLNAFS